MCSSLGPASLGLSEPPGLPGSLFRLPDWGKFSFIICSIKFSISCSSASPSGTPMIRMLEGEEEEQETENLFEQIMKENFPNLAKEIDF